MTATTWLVSEKTCTATCGSGAIVISGFMGPPTSIPSVCRVRHGEDWRLDARATARAKLLLRFLDLGVILRPLGRRILALAERLDVSRTLLDVDRALGARPDEIDRVRHL